MEMWRPTQLEGKQNLSQVCIAKNLTELGSEMSKMTLKTFGKQLTRKPY